ncbi:MAG: ribonuclease R [FCB group bacterium]|nr:ribonuclease R [FCB group bacterium]
MRDKILTFLRDHDNNRYRLKDLIQRLKIRPRERQKFKTILEDMVKEGVICLDKDNRYSVPKKSGVVEGKLVVVQKGFGFVITDDEQPDIFISRNNLRDAIHGDRVRVQLFRQRNVSRLRGRIVEVVERKTSRFIGTVTKEKNQFWLTITPVTPARGIRVVKTKGIDLKSNLTVVAEVVEWGTSRSPIVVTVKSIIGDSDDPENDFRIILEKYEFRAEFPHEVVNYCKRFSEATIKNELSKRKDLRSLKTCTIDPLEARDFDDALSIEKTRDGYVLYVHIADVSHFVTVGSPLDREAFKRSNSVYFTEGVVNMLPEVLAADLCSLKPEVDRLAMTAKITLDKNVKVLTVKVFPSVIRNDCRFTYQEVEDILKQQRSHRFLPELNILGQISRALFEQRSEWGSIDFDIPEPIFTLGEGGIPREIRPSERLRSHRIVEECMLLANRLVAEHYSRQDGKDVPFVFRIHEKPKPENVEQFIQLIRRLRLPIELKHDPSTSKGMREILASLEDSPFKGLLESVALRTMMKAKYSVTPHGHFGLAFHRYTHFTSPIRRYPDLMVHRLIKTRHYRQKKEKDAELIQVLQAGVDMANEMELRALEAEREYTKIKQLRWLNERIGESYTGIISGVIQIGFFVELEESLVEGLVHIDTLEEDEYYFDEDNYCLRGRGLKSIYQLGDTVKVRVQSVSFEKLRANFVLAD